MTHREPARRTTRRIPTLFHAGLLVVVAGVAASVGTSSLTSGSSRVSSSPPASSSPSAASRIPVMRVDPPDALDDAAGVVPDGRVVLRPEHRPALGEADGVIPDGTTAFDEIPGVANLDPDLLRALREAARDAADDGVEFIVESGWRSPQYQDQLLRQAIRTYGSAEEAAQWVATSDTSAHVTGDAVDIGPFHATAWLSAHGAEYMLCQIYRNEPWHYELRPGAIDHGCPRMYADPTRDPRMQK